MHHKQALFKFISWMRHFYAMCHLLPLLFSGWAGKGEVTASQSPSPHPLAGLVWILAGINTTGPWMETLSKPQAAVFQSSGWPWSSLGRQRWQRQSSRGGCPLWIFPHPCLPQLPKPWEGRVWGAPLRAAMRLSSLHEAANKCWCSGTRFARAKYCSDLACKSYRQTGANPKQNLTTMFEEKVVFITVIYFT